LSIQKVLILGIGNTLLTDEGIGIHLMKRMRDQVGELEGVEYMDGGTLSFTLADPIASADGLIVIDAARMDEPPGTLKVFHNEEMDRYLSGNRSSVHEVSLGDLLDISRLSESLPEMRCLVGIEPASMEWGERPTEKMMPAIEQGIKKITAILRDWGMA
jgi:hydrogenase maturation protease